MHIIDLLPSELGELQQQFNIGAAQTCSVESYHNSPVSEHRDGNDMPSETSQSCIRQSVLPQCLAGRKIYRNAEREFDHIRTAHRTLAPTGCTRDFCQSGRATRLNESRVGRDRPICEIEQEACNFLYECREKGVILSDEQLKSRIEAARNQIRVTAVEALVTDSEGNQVEGLAGGVWEQTFKELEYGVRAAWKNSRRCIMRSKYEQLNLCDLRNVDCSRGMAESIIREIRIAFNNGRIIPTAFVFAPRKVGTRGPMFWNNQIFAFAGYKLHDGSVMGDPANVSLTDGIIALGWKPPQTRSRWDLLPIVTMAEGEDPCIMELPEDLKRVIRITHPRYKQEFDKLDLRWVPAPALSRLGFDIGGNQYTASPFIGWFMDAEIGVRNLADSFRYNVLPQIVDQLQLSDDPLSPLCDLPEFMRLAALSRAQTELNFAVFYSFMNEQVTMVDTLTSSADYQKFDQEHKNETGYRLPADPYWLSPPQGSIVPLWHQGGAPNYQPKPMICRHAQDPVNAWKRENPAFVVSQQMNLLKIAETDVKPKISIFSCSAGINASKMAAKLYSHLNRVIREQRIEFIVEGEMALNSLNLANFSEKDIVLIIASTTGQGEVPRNAIKFVRQYEKDLSISSHPRFSIFGNGDSTYRDTYNAAGERIQTIMTNLGCQPLLGQIHTGDTALHNPNWTSFNRWREAVESILLGRPTKKLAQIGPLAVQASAQAMMTTATLYQVKRCNSEGLIHVTLDLGETTYQEMDYIKVMAPNNDEDVCKVLSSLGLVPEQILDWHHGTAHDFLSMHIDLHQSFKTLDWYPNVKDLDSCSQKRLKRSSISEVLTSLSKPVSATHVETICQSMASIRPRLFSVASSPISTISQHQSEKKTSNLVDIIVKMNPGGRFSDSFLQRAAIGTKLRVGLTRPDSWTIIQSQPSDAPIVAITTGSGIGPVRALLQRRLADQVTIEKDLPDCDSRCELAEITSSSIKNRSPSIFSNGSESTSTHHQQAIKPSLKGSINLFVGFKAHDTPFIHSLLKPMVEANLFNILELVPSNAMKIRVQDHLLLDSIREKLAGILRHPACVVFVCTNEAALGDVVRNLSEVLGEDVKSYLGQRFIEEVFRC